MPEINAPANTVSVRAFGRQMARELSAEEFATISEAASPTANPEIGVMTLNAWDWQPLA